MLMTHTDLINAKGFFQIVIIIYLLILLSQLSIYSIQHLRGIALGNGYGIMIFFKI